MIRQTSPWYVDRIALLMSDVLATANAFAMDVLFGEGGVAQFQALSHDREIADKAREIDITPGVAVDCSTTASATDSVWTSQALSRRTRQGSSSSPAHTGRSGRTGRP